MRRREFLGVLGGAAAAWPVVASGQSAQKRPLVAFLAGASSASAFSSTARSFVRGLRDQGYVEGRDIEIEFRFADGYFERLPALADELVKLKPDVILAPAIPPALAARNATSTIPIVCPLLENPIGIGLVLSHNRPGTNVTGILRYVDGLAGKNLEIAKLLLPDARRIGVLINPASGEAGDDKRRDIEVAASRLGVTLVPAEVQSPNNLDGAFEFLRSSNVQALVVLQDSLFFSEHQRIATLAAQSSMPVVWSTRIFTESGGLISYGVDEADSFRRAALFVAKIIKGERPSDLPIELPTKFELIINLKTAKTLGIGIPDKLLALSDEVIE